MGIGRSLDGQLCNILDERISITVVIVLEGPLEGDNDLSP